MDKKLYNLMNWGDVEEITYVESEDPHRILSPKLISKSTLYQAFFPDAKKVSVNIIQKNKPAIEKQMDLCDDAGFFAALVSCKAEQYTYKVTDGGGHVKVVSDPYGFAPRIHEKEINAYDGGVCYHSYDLFGAHVKTINKITGVLFTLYAPNAMRVSVVGDFNAWNSAAHQMRKISGRVFELFIPEARPGDCYKYEIKLHNGTAFMKSDPYAFHKQADPDMADVIADISGFKWTDKEYLGRRAQSANAKNIPVSILELTDDSFPDIVNGEVPAGITHVAMTLNMRSSYYAPGEKFKNPKELAVFIDKLHQKGVGLIMKWSPSEFTPGQEGLSDFDGTCLYEHLDVRRGFFPKNGMKLYNYTNKHVTNFLISNALFWAKRYHIDGIMIEGLSIMLYLDYDKQRDEWLPNIYGGTQNLEAIEFIKHFNSVMHKLVPDVTTIAKTDTVFSNITKDLESEGLGFDLSVNHSFAKSLADYLRLDPFLRSRHHNELTMSASYAYYERYILPIGGFEDVFGDDADQFATIRSALALAFMHPGKKLLYQTKRLSDDEGYHKLIIELLSLYNKKSPLYCLDEDAEGFAWINKSAASESVIVFCRNGKQQEERLIVAANFSGALWEDFTFGVPLLGKYKEIFNSDHQDFGGENRLNSKLIIAKEAKADEMPYSVRVTLAPLTLTVLEYVPFSKKELDAMEQKKKKQEELILNKAKKAEEVKLERAKKKAELKKIKNELALELKQKLAEAKARL